MAFGDSLKQRNEGAQGNRVSPYLALKPGEYTIRILDTEETTYWRYWLPVNVGGKRQGRSITVGPDNPIRDYMLSLGKEHPQYQSVSRRCVINVLHRSPVIILEDGKVLNADERGQYILDGKRVNGTPVPENAVKILEFGNSVLESLSTLNGRMRSRTRQGEMVDINGTDILLIVTGEGTKKNTQPLQGFDEGDLPAELASLPRYDLAEMVKPMPNEQVQALLDGEDYNEIYKQLGWAGNYPMKDSPYTGNTRKLS